MPKPRRLWFPLDVNFTRDEKVMDAGWPAAELYVAGLGALTLGGSVDGKITRLLVSKSGVARPYLMANRLVKAGLWDEIDPDTYRVVAWESWHTETDDARRMREYRARLRDRSP